MVENTDPDSFWNTPDGQAEMAKQSMRLSKDMRSAREEEVALSTAGASQQIVLKLSDAGGATVGGESQRILCLFCAKFAFWFYGTFLSMRPSADIGSPRSFAMHRSCSYLRRQTAGLQRPICNSISRSARRGGRKRRPIHSCDSYAGN
jgi:hypothetical protein